MDKQENTKNKILQILEKVKELLKQKKALLPSADYAKLIEGNETNFIFLEVAGKLVPAKLKIPQDLIINPWKIDQTPNERILLLFMPSKDLYIPPQIKTHFSSRPDLFKEILNKGYAIEDNSVYRIHPYLNRIEKYSKSSLTIPYTLRGVELSQSNISELKNGIPVQFIQEGQSYTAKIDYVNKVLRVHKSENFKNTQLNYDFVQKTNIPLTTTDPLKFITQNNDGDSQSFSVSPTKDFIDNGHSLENLFDLIKQNPYLDSLFDLKEKTLADFKIERLLNEFENRIQNKITNRFITSQEKSGNFLLNSEPFYFAKKSMSAFKEESEYQNKALLNSRLKALDTQITKIAEQIDKRSAVTELPKLTSEKDETKKQGGIKR